MNHEPRMRPRFEARRKGSVASFRAALKNEITHCEDCLGEAYRSNAAVWIENRTYWSPYLNLIFEEDEENKGTTIIRGRFSPHPDVWTMFMAIYFALALSGVGCMVYAMVEFSLHHTLWWMLGVPLSMVAIAFVFGASLIGQGLSADEMYTLRRMVDRALDSDAVNDQEE